VLGIVRSSPVVGSNIHINRLWLTMTSLPHYVSPIETVRRLASGEIAAAVISHGVVPFAQEDSEHAMRRDLSKLVASVDTEDRASLDMIRLPLLRKIVLWEWGESALTDHFAMALLRATDRLIAIDPEMRKLLRRAVVALKKSSDVGI
jgi:hypothetical protein